MYYQVTFLCKKEFIRHILHRVGKVMLYCHWGAYLFLLTRIDFGKYKKQKRDLPFYSLPTFFIKGGSLNAHIYLFVRSRCVCMPKWMCEWECLLSAYVMTPHWAIPAKYIFLRKELHAFDCFVFISSLIYQKFVWELVSLHSKWLCSVTCFKIFIWTKFRWLNF